MEENKEKNKEKNEQKVSSANDRNIEDLEKSARKMSKGVFDIKEMEKLLGDSRTKLYEQRRSKSRFGNKS